MLSCVCAYPFGEKGGARVTLPFFLPEGDVDRTSTTVLPYPHSKQVRTHFVPTISEKGRSGAKKQRKKASNLQKIGKLAYGGEIGKLTKGQSTLF